MTRVLGPTNYVTRFLFLTNQRRLNHLVKNNKFASVAYGAVGRLLRSVPTALALFRKGRDLGCTWIVEFDSGYLMKYALTSYPGRHGGIINPRTKYDIDNKNKKLHQFLTPQLCSLQISFHSRLRESWRGHLQ
jgi:hypothetical protein